MFTTKRSQQLQDDQGRYFIDRDGDRFKYVLNYLRDGESELPPDSMVEDVLKEAKYFQLQELVELLERQPRIIHKKMETKLLGPNYPSFKDVFLQAVIQKHELLFKAGEAIPWTLPLLLGEGKCPRANDKLRRYYTSSTVSKQDIDATVKLNVQIIAPGELCSSTDFPTYTRNYRDDGNRYNFGGAWQSNKGFPELVLPPNMNMETIRDKLAQDLHQYGFMVNEAATRWNYQCPVCEMYQHDALRCPFKIHILCIERIPSDRSMIQLAEEASRKVKLEAMGIQKSLNELSGSMHSATEDIPQVYGMERFLEMITAILEQKVCPMMEQIKNSVST